MSHTIVVGAGWAGLSCAYTLVKNGHRVTLIEAAPQAGGRARSVKFADDVVDNGQHLCIGAYHSVLELIKELGLDIAQFFQISPMEIVSIGVENFHLKMPNLPAPFNILWGLVSTKHLTMHDKLVALKFSLSLRKMGFLLQKDCTVLELLTRYNQSTKLISSFWEPIALAAMTTPIKSGSAQVFLNTLKLSFTQTNNDSKLYFPRTDLSNLLPQHLEKYLLDNKCQIIYSKSVKSLTNNANTCVEVCSQNEKWQADNVVLALPPWAAADLIEMPLLKHFAYQPITTVYLKTESSICLPYPMLGVNGYISQWIFDRRFAGQPNILSVIISGPGDHEAMDNTGLLNKITEELSALLPNMPPVIASKVIREKRAAFTCDVRIQPRRPFARTPISNVWLAGDYLQTGLPATLEGAVRSGIQTGKAILDNISPRSNQNV